MGLGLDGTLIFRFRAGMALKRGKVDEVLAGGNSNKGGLILEWNKCSCVGVNDVWITKTVGLSFA